MVPVRLNPGHLLVGHVLDGEGRRGARVPLEHPWARYGRRINDPDSKLIDLFDR